MKLKNAVIASALLTALIAIGTGLAQQGPPVTAASTLKKQQGAGASKCSGLPSFTLKKDASGTRVLFPIKGGNAEHRKPLRTTKGMWHTGNPPITLEIACSTYHNSRGGFCGVVCSDNSWYGMDCGADIFASGFDIED